MQRRRMVVAGLLAVLLLTPAMPAWAADDTAAIRAVLDAQQEAWNRGDIPTFMKGYKDAQDTTFIGAEIRHGYQMILDRYQHAYVGKEGMGTLAFSDVQIRMLGADYAVVTGKFHLTRTAAGGGDAQGVYSLVFEKEHGAWKIILDHTTAQTSAAQTAAPPANSK